MAITNLLQEKYGGGQNTAPAPTVKKTGITNLLATKYKTPPKDVSSSLSKTEIPTEKVAPPAPVDNNSSSRITMADVGNTLKDTAKEGINKIKEFIDGGRINKPEAQFKTALYEGLTPEEKVRAQKGMEDILKQAHDEYEATHEKIKLPFVDAGIDIPKEKSAPLDVLGVKNIVEAPEKLARTFTEAAGITPFSDEQKTEYKVNSYGEEGFKLYDHFKQNGHSTPVSILMSGALVGLDALGSLAPYYGIYRGMLSKGAQSAAEGQIGKITDNQWVTAHEKLGAPKTLEEAKQNYYKLIHEFHPDKPGGNTEIAQQLNDAWAILQKKGVPSDSFYGGFVDRRPQPPKTEPKQIGDGSKPAPEVVPPPKETPIEPAKNIPETAESFVERKGLDPAGVSILDNENSIVEATSGNPGILTELPLTIFRSPKFETLNQSKYTPGRKILDPIEATIYEGKLRITDGANRFTQAIANGDETIPVVVENFDGSLPTREQLAEIQQEAPTKKGTRIVVENTVEKGKEEGIDYNPETQVKIGDEVIEKPKSIVSKSDLKDLMKNIGSDEIHLTMQEDGLHYSDPNRKLTFIMKPSALGLVPGGIKTGDIVTINKNDLNVKGTAKETSIRAVNDKGETVASEIDAKKEDGLNFEPARSPEEIKHRIEQLNKFGQSNAILRKTGGLSKRHAGVFKRGKGISDKGEVRLQDKMVGANSRNYMETLGHELGHALEFQLTGSTGGDTYKVFGRDLSQETVNTIKKELKAVTNDLVGEEKAKRGASYYYKDTELLARFFEKMFASPGNLAELAPTAMEHIELSAIENPIIAEYLEAVAGEIDKGQLQHVFFRDMRETYQKWLGKRVGDQAFNNEIRYRAMKERAKAVIEREMNDKFKDVEDTPDQLFQAAESISVTKNGVPEFGTRDFEYAENDKEADKLIKAGWEPLKDKYSGSPVYDYVGDKQYQRYFKTRYTHDEAKAIYDSLSPEGKALIKDFTAEKNEARDFFNRELIKDNHEIASNIEGYVHHYWNEKPSLFGSKKFKMKKSASQLRRKVNEEGEKNEGYVEDLKLAMTKALTELETNKAYNNFIEEYFAQVTEPIAKGAEPKPGYIEVTGNIRKEGVGRNQEMGTKILKDDQLVQANKPRYQMRKEIYQRYQMIKDVADEASTAVRIVNSLNKYWQANILFHPGSAATNFLSGGVQYGAKLLDDFYMEVLTGKVKMEKTRRNLTSLVTALTPKGWQAAPDWIYGGDLSNYYGQFMNGKNKGIEFLDQGSDIYADKALKVYGLVERYWKKVISLSEDSSQLASLNKMSKEGLRLPTDEENELLDIINKNVDFFAYDYDNVSPMIEKYQNNAGAQAIKPFIKYPYKYMKMVTNMAQSAFDGTLPWQERVSKILTLATIISIYAYYRSQQKEKQKTPEVPDSAPASVSTRGRLYIGTDDQGNEMFTRVAKYPFINFTESAIQLMEGNSAQAFQGITDMLGGVAPIGQAALALMGYSNKFQQYVPTEVTAGDALASYIPGTRIMSDISRYFDPYQRKKTDFSQSFTSLYPILSNDEALREKLRGDIKTIKVPLEGNIEPNEGEGTRRTTTDKYVKNFSTDILWSLLAGIYINRIDPDVAGAFAERKKKNEEKAKEKEDKK